MSGLNGRASLIQNLEWQLNMYFVPFSVSGKVKISSDLQIACIQALRCFVISKEY